MNINVNKVAVLDNSASEDKSDQGFDYENFMRVCPVYHAVNQQLIESAEISAKKRIVDLGCGTGNITRSIIEQLDSLKDVVIYAVDTSQSMLREAARRLNSFRDTVEIKFIHGDVLEVPDKIGEQVDAIVYCNSIHYVHEKVQLMKNVKNLLVRGGIFAANSSFIRESHAEEHIGSDYKFYLNLMLNAIKTLKRSYRMLPNRYVVESRKRLGVGDYSSLVESVGMRLLCNDLDIRSINFDCWYNFLNFKDFVEGALPGVPIPIGRTVLKEAAKKLMLDSNRYSTFQRAWIQLVAQKV